jgi:hypothetical protein
MEYHFDHRIRLNQESEYKNLYSWSLRELSETGEQLGSDQVPWHWSLYFSAGELRYNKELSLERQGDPEDILPSQEGVSSSESISAVLHSGVTNADGYFEQETVFSMFGTERQIKEFSLIIRPLEEGGSEQTCRIWGCVSYTSEIDFRTETEDDILQISVEVSLGRFKELRDLVNHVRPNILFIRLGRVSGFYSEWSPSVSTNRIKVLTRGSEHNVELPDECEVDPPRLGTVGEFVLTVARRNALELKREPDVWVEGEEDELVESEEISIREPEQTSNAIFERLARNQAALERLKWPIWAIVLLLLLLYLK